MKVTIEVGAILLHREEPAAVVLEGGVEVRHRTENTRTGHRETHLEAAMEEVVLERLEGEQEDPLELVEATADGEDPPMEGAQASVEVQQALVVLEALAEARDLQQAAMATLMKSEPADVLVRGMGDI